MYRRNYFPRAPVTFAPRVTSDPARVWWVTEPAACTFYGLYAPAQVCCCTAHACPIVMVISYNFWVGFQGLDKGDLLDFDL